MQSTQNNDKKIDLGIFSTSEVKKRLVFLKDSGIKKNRVNLVQENELECNIDGDETTRYFYETFNR